MNNKGETPCHGASREDWGGHTFGGGGRVGSGISPHLSATGGVNVAVVNNNRPRIQKDFCVRGRRRGDVSTGVRL